MTYKEFSERLDELMNPVLDLVASVQPAEGVPAIQAEDCREVAKAELLMLIDELKESYGEILDD